MATSYKGLFLNQRRYVLDLLKDAKMIDAKHVPIPLDSKLKLKTTSEALGSVNYYQHLLARLIYLTITRPDITYTVSLVSQFMHTPIVFHLNLVKRILHYLKGSPGRGIVMNNHGHTQITGYSDSDWAGNAIDRKSTIGFCMFVGGNPIS